MGQNGKESGKYLAPSSKTAETIGAQGSGFGFSVPAGGYDQEDRLTAWNRTDGARNQSWTLSAVGDWTAHSDAGVSQTRTHAAAHELTGLTTGGTTSPLGYDPKGNLLSRPAALASPALGLVWDFDNRLRGADTNGTPASQEVSFEYDALGRRVARSETGNNVVYIHAGQQVIADYARGAAAAAPSFRYVYGSYVDEPLLRHAGTGTTLPTSGTAALYYHRNQQYSIVGLSDAAGALVERYAYTAYGELTILAPDRTLRPTSSFQNRYTYTGREWDPTLRLYYFRARWLEPKAGRFIGRDPLGYVDGMSLYGAYFVPRNLDPFGMHVCHCFGNHGVGGIPNWNAKENKYFFISDEKNEDEATLECEENCRRYATSRPLTTWAFKIITDNRGQGLGQFHYTFHGLLLEFSPVSSPEAKSSLLDELYQDLKTFRHFNDGFNVDGSVEFGPDGRLAYFDALSDGPELPPFGVLSDFINDNYTPVALEFDDTNRTVTGRTLPGHMLEGKRTWTVEEPRAGNNNEVLSAGCRFVVLVRTVAVERKVGLANDLGAKFAGTKLQMRVWDSYLKNIAKYYTSPKRQPRAKVIARTSNERQAAPNEYPW